MEENFLAATKEMTSILQAGLNGLESLVNNQNGADGFDGMHAISSLGPIYLYGDGSVKIVGGNGVDGADARHGLVGSNAAKGGKGGDAGCAIVADLLIENVGGGAVLRSGTPGKGGAGAGESGSNGSRGSSDNYRCTFYYFKRKGS